MGSKSQNGAKIETILWVEKVKKVKEVILGGKK